MYIKRYNRVLYTIDFYYFTVYLPDLIEMRAKTKFLNHY